MTFFVAAYVIVWAGLGAYLLRLVMRFRALGEEVRMLAADGEAARGARRPSSSRAR